MTRYGKREGLQVSYWQAGIQWNAWMNRWLTSTDKHICRKAICMVDVSTTYRTYRVNFCTDIDVTFIWRLHRYRQTDRQTNRHVYNDNWNNNN